MIVDETFREVRGNDAKLVVCLNANFFLKIVSFLQYLTKSSPTICVH